VTCLAGGERKSKHCAIISSVKPTTPYNKVHNRGCSLSIFFFTFYMRRTSSANRGRKASAGTSCKKKEPVESVFIKRVGWAVSSTLKALETSKNACLIIYKRQKCQQLCDGRSFYFLSFHELSTYYFYSWRLAWRGVGIPMVWYGAVVVAHTRTHTLDDSGVMVLCCKGVALLFPVCLSQDT